MTKNLVILAAAVLGTSTAATPAMAGHIRVEHVADRLVDDLEDLGEEFRDDYRYVPEYRSLLATTLDMHRLACQIERLADCKGSVYEIDGLVCSLERLLPHLQSTIAQVHCHNLHGATRGVARNLKDIVEGICELREEIAEMKFKARRHHAPVIHHNVIHRDVIHRDVIHHDAGHRGGHNRHGSHGHDRHGSHGHDRHGSHGQVQFGVKLGKGGPTLGFGRGGVSIGFGR